MRYFIFWTLHASTLLTIILRKKYNSFLCQLYFGISYQRRFSKRKSIVSIIEPKTFEVKFTALETPLLINLAKGKQLSVWLWMRKNCIWFLSKFGSREERIHERLLPGDMSLLISSRLDIYKIIVLERAKKGLQSGHLKLRLDFHLL